MRNLSSCELSAIVCQPAFAVAHCCTCILIGSHVSKCVGCVQYERNLAYLNELLGNTSGSQIFTSAAETRRNAMNAVFYNAEQGKLATVHSSLSCGAALDAL